MIPLTRFPYASKPWLHWLSMVGNKLFFGFQMANPWRFPGTNASSKRFNDFDLNFGVEFRPWALGARQVCEAVGVFSISMNAMDGHESDTWNLLTILIN